MRTERSCADVYGEKWTVLICVDFWPFDLEGERLADSERSSDSGTMEDADVRVCVFAMPKIRRDDG